MTTKLKWLGGVIATSCLFLASANILADALGGKETSYTAQLAKRLEMKDDPFRDQAKMDDNGIGFVCFKDPGDEYYVGAGQFQTIAAPIEAVAKVLSDFDKYPQWTDGLVESKTTPLEPNMFLVATEQEIPIPFVSNIHTQLFYEVKSAKERTHLRYQLKKSDSLTAYDGLIILEALPNNQTKFTEYDILNADWGVAKAMGAKKIWLDSLKAMYQGDFALKLQTENPSTSLKEILKKSTKEADKRDLNDCFEKRQPLKF